MVSKYSSYIVEIKMRFERNDKNYLELCQLKVERTSVSMPKISHEEVICLTTEILVDKESSKNNGKFVSHVRIIQ